MKNLFTVDGLPNRAISRLPAEAFEGPQASVVSRLIDSDALVLGKTTTDEFAYGDPPVQWLLWVERNARKIAATMPPRSLPPPKESFSWGRSAGRAETLPTGAGGVCTGP